MTTQTPTIDDIATRNVASVAVLMPPGLKDRIKEHADSIGQSSMQYIRELVARDLGYELPAATERTRVSKYASAEEKEAATKAKAKERRDLIKDLMAKHRAAQASAEA